MLGAVAIGNQVEFPLPSPNGFAKLDHLGFRGDARKGEELVNTPLVGFDDSQITINLANALLDLSQIGIDFGKLPLSCGEHVFDRSSLFSLAESLHFFLRNSHFFLEAIALFEQELCRRLRRIGTPLVHITNVFIREAVC